jgi:2,3-bisphosphoglycerate-independent phosphoglycerate mutase
MNKANLMIKTKVKSLKSKSQTKIMDKKLKKPQKLLKNKELNKREQRSKNKKNKIHDVLVLFDLPRISIKLKICNL